MSKIYWHLLLPAHHNTPLLSSTPAHRIDRAAQPTPGQSLNITAFGPGTTPNETAPTPYNAHPPSLPCPIPPPSPLFTWGAHDAETFMHSITAAYSETVHWRLHWRTNTFPIPYGNAGKKLVSELSKLFRPMLRAQLYRICCSEGHHSDVNTTSAEACPQLQTIWIVLNVACVPGWVT